ncbi:HAD-IC family P-type ATPase, partial [Cloacibacillus evryensis]|uniref:HAD-IC family P-type ATPase n=1 Tax=Cloacibacillus evryensis TaxID=508460 RepID=UPI00210C0AAF
TELAGIICIDDPLRGEAREVVSGLRAEGVPHLVKLTGDCRRAAENTAAQLGIGEVRSEMLPVDKSEYVRRLTVRRRAVIMVGDGVNDSPALSAASVGVSMRS